MVKEDLYFRHRDIFFSSIEEYGIEPDSKVATFFWNKFCDNIHQYGTKYRKCIEDMLDRYPKMYQIGLRDQEEFTGEDTEPVDKFIENNNNGNFRNENN